MSILSMEYDQDAAIRVRVEEEREDIAREMLADGEPIEKIIKWTKLSLDAIKNLQ